jgi:SAM-dependent methyltransferase
MSDAAVDTDSVEIDPRIRHHYEVFDEQDRLWQPGLGELVRLRTWDIFDRLLSEPVSVADIGGGPGTHAAHLARRGHDVVLIEPVARHVDAAERCSAAQPQAPFRARLGEARNLPLLRESVDVALLLGPLYHLVDRPDRLAALREAARVLRPGGRIFAEVITRYARVMDATLHGQLGDAETWAEIDRIQRTGHNKDPEEFTGGGFWAYFHRVDELVAELEVAGFRDIRLLAVTGFAGLLGDLPRRMRDPDALLRAIRLTESEPSMLGASSHLIAVAGRPSGR